MIDDWYSYGEIDFNFSNVSGGNLFLYSLSQPPLMRQSPSSEEWWPSLFVSVFSVDMSLECVCGLLIKILFFLSNNFHVLQTSTTNKMKMEIQYKI